MRFACVSETPQTLGSPSKGWGEKSGKFVGMCTFIHWILCNSAGLVKAPPSWKGAFLLFSGCGVLWLPPPRAEFPAPGSRVSVRFEARQRAVGQGGRGRDELWPLNCTSDWYCLSFRHLCFLSLGSKVTANFLATHTSHKRSGNITQGHWGSGQSAALPLGRLPLQPLPRLENQTVLREPEIAPFAAERQGGGAGGNAGPAGRGVERATFTGPGGFTPAGLGGLTPGV